MLDTPSVEPMVVNIAIPSKLKQEPLLEAVWEARFSTDGESHELLPGMVRKAFHDSYQTVVRLPVADIPYSISQRDPALRYAPRLRLEEGNLAIQLGAQTAALTCRAPYIGWKRFSAEIHRLANALAETKLIRKLERHSLKYVDLQIGERKLVTNPIQLRTEISEDAFVHLVQIVTPATVTIQGQTDTKHGTLIDVDTIRIVNETESWADLLEELDDLHMACKRMFFQLLKRETIQKLEPEYDD